MFSYVTVGRWRLKAKSDCCRLLAPNRDASDEDLPTGMKYASVDDARRVGSY